MENQRNGSRRIWSALPRCEDGGGRPWAKECRWPLNAEKVKKMDAPLEPPERSVALLTPWLCSPLRPASDFWPTELSNNKLVFFKQPSLQVICYSNKRKLIHFPNYSTVLIASFVGEKSTSKQYSTPTREGVSCHENENPPVSVGIEVSALALPLNEHRNWVKHAINSSQLELLSYHCTKCLFPGPCSPYSCLWFFWILVWFNLSI